MDNELLNKFKINAIIKGSLAFFIENIFLLMRLMTGKGN
jgi:hypothetical protein